MYCAMETLLRCIRCKRPYCLNCLERQDAGNICFDCLGLPPPDIQMRSDAAGKVLKLTGISSLVGILHVFISLERPFSNWGIVLGVVVGFLVATRIVGMERNKGMRGAILFGSMTVLQGLLIAVVVISVLHSSGFIQSETLLVPRGSLPEMIADLAFRALFYYLASVVTVITVFWQRSRF